MRVTPPSGPRGRGPRGYLEPLGQGPWLRDTSPDLLPGQLIGWGLALFFLTWGAVSVFPKLDPQGVPSILVVGAICLAALLVGAGLLLGLLNGFTPDWTQVCPQCLQGMARTATRCPHCHFTPSRSDG